MTPLEELLATEAIREKLAKGLPLTPKEELVAAYSPLLYGGGCTSCESNRREGNMEGGRTWRA